MKEEEFLDNQVSIFNFATQNCHGFYHLIFEDFFDFAATRFTRANHQYKLNVKPARLNCYKHSFFIRIVTLWNEFPRDVVVADNLQRFKYKLKLYLNI